MSHTFVRWDGKGVPRRIASRDVPMSVRLMQLADFAEVHHRLHGIEGAVGMARRRAGKLLWPELVKTFCEAAPELLRDLDETTWDQVIAAEPSPRQKFAVATRPGCSSREVTNRRRTGTVR